MGSKNLELALRAAYATKSKKNLPKILFLITDND